MDSIDRSSPISALGPDLAEDAISTSSSGNAVDSFETSSPPSLFAAPVELASGGTPRVSGWTTYSGPSGAGWADKSTAIRDSAHFLHHKSQSYVDKSETGGYVVQRGGNYHLLWKKGTPDSVPGFTYKTIRSKGYNPVAALHTHPTTSYREGPSAPDVLLGERDWRNQAKHGSTFENYVIASDGDVYHFWNDSRFGDDLPSAQQVIEGTNVEFRFDVDPSRTVDKPSGLDYIPEDERSGGSPGQTEFSE